MLIIGMIFFSSIVIICEKNNVKSNPGGDSNGLSLDINFIINITQNLSSVIFDAYEEGELQKGRAFGTKGEHYAADYLYDLIVSIETFISRLIEYSI